MLQKKLIQILNKNSYKKNFYIFLLILCSFYFTFYYGYQVYSFRQFLIYDAGFKVLSGGHPFRLLVHHRTNTRLSSVFLFKIFGVNWFSYVLHAAINILITILLFHFLRKLDVSLKFSFIYSISVSILAYPSVELHLWIIMQQFFSVFFNILILAFKKNENISWFIVPIFLSASFLSKQFLQHICNFIHNIFFSMVLIF